MLLGGRTVALGAMVSTPVFPQRTTSNQEDCMSDLLKKYASFGERVDDAGFRAAYDDVWPRCRERFLKLEAFYEYQEPDNVSLQAFIAGDVARSRAVIQEGLKRSLPFYAQVRAMNIDLHRVRPVPWPLTDYLKWEFISYQESIRQGERISIYRDTVGAAYLYPKVSDFLIFDDFACFLHCYTDSGDFKGGVVVKDKGVVNEVAEIHHHIASLAVPFAQAVALTPKGTWQLL
jgi:hypothetical protein